MNMQKKTQELHLRYNQLQIIQIGCIQTTLCVVKFHVQRFHEYGEECALYPCELCGYRGQDVDALRDHLSEYHENPEKS